MTHPNPSTTPRSPAKLLLLSITVLAISLSLAEVALRIHPMRQPIIMYDALTNHLEKVHLHFFTDLVVSDHDVFWKLAPGKTIPDDHPNIFGLVSNQEGLREDHEIPENKPEGEIRILFIGDSCTFGFGVRYDQTFVERVERQLRVLYPDVRVECINAGVSGYTLAQGWRYLETRGIDYDPDLVISCFGWNDAKHWTSRDDLERMDDARLATPPGPLAYSEFCRNLWALAVRALVKERAESAIRVNPEKFRLLLNRIDALAAAQSFRFIPMVQSVKGNVDHESAAWTPYQLAVVKHKPLVTRDDGILCINPVPALDRAVKSGMPVTNLFLDGVHTTGEANEIVANDIVERIRPWYEQQVVQVQSAPR